MQHGADINAKDIDGNTPCHFCSEYGYRFCLKFLLTKQPYLFSNNNENKSAIDVAINNDILTVSTIFQIINTYLNYRNSRSSSPKPRISQQRKRRSSLLMPRAQSQPLEGSIQKTTKPTSPSTPQVPIPQMEAAQR